jgi:hypothetical protein
MKKPACGQTAILRLLVEATVAVSLSDICARFPRAPRKRVTFLLFRLMQQKLVRSVRLEGRGHYSATPRGRAFIREGRAIKPGPRGERTGVTVHTGTFRARAWAALRMKTVATLGDLAECARTARDKDPVGNAQSYMVRLRRAGIVMVMPERARGHAPKSPGFIRIRLLNDLGPKAPIVTRDGVFDHNARARIAYAEARP